MDRKEEKGSSEAKPRYVWDPKKLAWVEATEAETTEEAVPEKAAVEPTREEVLEEVKAEEVAGEALVEGAPAEAVAESGGLQYKGAGIRLLAFIIDAVVVIIILYLFNQVSGSQVLVNTASEQAFNSLSWHQWVFIGILAVYFIGFWAWRGQTLGKMLVGAKIVKNDGGKIGIVRALVRYIVYFLYLLLWGFANSSMFILVIIAIVAIIIVASNKKKRGIHDFIAGTVVINSRPPEPMEVEASAAPETDELTDTSEASEPLGTSEPESDKQA
jgi:uncharacterized RDD family membrane protein YckC